MLFKTIIKARTNPNKENSHERFVSRVQQINWISEETKEVVQGAKIVDYVPLSQFLRTDT